MQTVRNDFYKGMRQRVLSSARRTLKWLVNFADGSEVTEGGYAKIQPIYPTESADRSMPRDFVERAYHRYLGKCSD